MAFYFLSFTSTMPLELKLYKNYDYNDSDFADIKKKCNE